MKWALDHEEQLNKRNSVLIFKLYKLKFIEKLKKIDEEIQDYKRNGNLNDHHLNLQNGDLKENDQTMIDDTTNISRGNSIVGSNHNLAVNSNESDDYVSRLEKELISFARTNFQPYFSKYGKEIQQLMCCFLYLPSGLRKCPYRNLFNIQESEVVDLFTREACSLLGLSVRKSINCHF